MRRTEIGRLDLSLLNQIVSVLGDGGEEGWDGILAGEGKE